MPARLAPVSPSLSAALLAGLMLPWLSACGGGGSSPTEPPAAAAPAEVLNGISVPLAPDPVANAATLAGVDSNANALRDDVERQLAMAATSAQMFAGSAAIAKAQQALVTTPSTTRERALTRVQAVVCAMQTAMAAGLGVADALDTVLDTVERRDAFAAQGSLLGATGTDELGPCS